MTLGFADIVVAPHLPVELIAVLAVAAGVVLVLGLARRARGAWLRTLPLAALVVALLDPRLVREQRTPQNDVAVVVVDDSASQGIGDRRPRTAEALETLRRRLDRQPRLDVRVERVAPGGGGVDEGTRLFAAVHRATADVPRRRLAGVVLITDGQVHDIPVDAAAEIGAPVHALLTGKPGEGDRRLIVDRAPGYGIVGKQVGVTVRIEDSPPPPDAGTRIARLTIRRDGGAPPSVITVPVGQPHGIEVDVAHGGTNVVEMQVEPGPAELSLANNHTAIAVSGVRDRLRVLLISGRPHSGERTWRNILKSDANVDLVHFTILRPLEKDDFTPLSELALIAFPMRELFEERLGDFDLVIFDRYGRHSLVPLEYIENVANYVRKGGAVMLAVGPEFAGNTSLAQTPLGGVLPATPTGQVFEEGFLPKVTETGSRHPVTSELSGSGAPVAEAGKPQPRHWGRWLRHIDADPKGGEVLMTGVGDRPLLMLDRVGEGRVALLLSDTIWLWARGYEGGGPQAELLRRLAHWLMHEPALEENSLSAEVRGGVLAIDRRGLKPGPAKVTVTTPSGGEHTLDMTEEGNGRSVASLEVAEPGLYRVTDGERTAVAAAGSLNPIELADLTATDRLLRPVAEATGGGVFWLSGSGVPDIHRVRPGRPAAGKEWLGLAANGDYTVTGVREVPLMPAALALTLIVGGLILAWYREGR